MDWVKQRYDQFLLLLAALALAGVSGFVTFRALGFKAQFAAARAPVARNDELPAADLSQFEAARASLGSAPEWGAGAKGSLFVSKKFVVKEGQLVSPLDDPNAPPIQPPVENAWFEKFGLDILNPGILSEDPDQDGFSNLDEWEGRTDPTAKAAHPPYVSKLRLKQFIKQPFRLLFPSYDGDPKDPESLTFQINTIDVRQPSQFLKMGAPIAGTKFKIVGFEYKTTVTESNVVKDVSELTVENAETGQRVVLVKERIVDSPDSFALFRYLWDSTELRVKKDAEFTLKPTDEKYKLVDISDQGAVIESLINGEKHNIRRLEK